MLKTLLLLLLIAIVAVLIYAATRPDTFTVQRSVTIQAPPGRIQPLIADLRQFNTWNPFEKKDPSVQGSYGEKSSGIGASYAWQGDKAGSGSMRVAEIVPEARVTMLLDFVKPFQAHNIVDFTLTPEAGATRVTWAMRGDTPYIAKVIQVFFSMDKMVGGDFESGLADLKRRAEAG